MPEIRIHIPVLPVRNLHLPDRWAARAPSAEVVTDGLTEAVRVGRDVDKAYPQPP